MIAGLDPSGSVVELLERGATLPATWYGDPLVLEREREAIFRRAWQYAGPADQVAEPGQYLTCTAGHVPVVVTRDRDGRLNGLVNVCRHRGHVVAEGAGRRETLQCPYHAWTYGLDGCLRGAPRSNREPGFDASGLSLLPVQVEEWGPLLFVNPDLDAPSFEETYPELRGLVERSGVDLERLEFRGEREWESPVNWKLGVENHLERYHEARFHFLWPNTAFNIEPGSSSFIVMHWRPVTPRRTHGCYDYFFGRDVPEGTARELIEFSRQVGAEDRSLVESVQRGLDSGIVPHRPLLPESERLIRHFQRLVYDAVT